MAQGELFTADKAVCCSVFVLFFGWHCILFISRSLMKGLLPQSTHRHFENLFVTAVADLVIRRKGGC